MYMDKTLMYFTQNIVLWSAIIVDIENFGAFFKWRLDSFILVHVPHYYFFVCENLEFFLNSEILESL
jgi:hypothetical protein